MYPAFLILDRNDEEIGRLMGAGLTLKDFIERGKDAVDLRNSAGYLKKQYDSTKSGTIALKYLDARFNEHKKPTIQPGPPPRSYLPQIRIPESSVT